MATVEYEGGTGGKFRKRPLRRVPSTPYDRPPLAASGIHGLPPETEAGGSRWFSKLVDPASQVIVRNASRLLSVFGKGLAAPPGEHINIIEEVPKMKLSPEISEHGENPADVRHSGHYVGTDRSQQELISRNDSIFELEQLLKQKRFSRSEIDHLAELLHSRTIEPSVLPSTDYKNKGKINEDSSINSSSSQHAVNHEEKENGKPNPSKLECQIEQLVNLNENVTSGVHVNIFEEGFDSPIEIARAYMGLKPRKAALSSLGLQNQTCHRDTASPLNFHFGNKPSNAAIASSSTVFFPVIPRDAGSDCMTQKPQSRSALYKFSRSPYGRSFMRTNPREYSPYKDNNVELTRSLEWTPSLSNIRHSGHGQALKRGSSKRDAGFFGDAQRTCQKSCLKDLNLSTPVNTSSTFILDQEYKHDIDLKGLDNLDCKIPSSILHVPPHSVEMARKILHQLDKLNPSPQNNSSEKKVIVGDASLSKSSFSASHEGSLKIKANNGSTKLLNVRGSRILEEPSSSNLARITSSASPSKDKSEGEASLIPYISVAQVASGIGMNSSGISASVANYSMKSMESNGHGFSLFSMQKEPTVQNAPDDNIESTKAEQAILTVKDPMEKSFDHSFEYVPTSGLMHTDIDTKASNKTYTERNVSFNFLAAHTFNTLSKRLLSSTMAITLADGATSKEDSVSPLKFGSKVSTYNATKPISTGISARLNAGSLSVVSSSTGNGAPKFQFGSGNSSSYSFTGLSAVSSSIGIGVCTPAFSYLYQRSEGSGSLPTSAVFPISANGVFGVSTSPTSVGSSLQFSSSSSPKTTINFGAVAESFCGTEGISSGNILTNSPVASGLGSSLQASCSTQIGFAVSGVKPFTASFSSSSGGTSSCRNSSLSPAVPVSFSTSSSPFLSSSSLSTTLGFTPLSSPSTGFAFGPTATSGSMPFLLSSRSILPPASTGTTNSTASLSPTQTVFGSVTSTMGFGPVSHSNDQMIFQDTSTCSNLQAAPTGPTPGQPTNLQPVLSRAQVFQFGMYQNSSPVQTFANPGFSSRGSFSLNSVDGKSSE